MQTLRGLGQRCVLTLLNVGALVFCQRCIPGVISRSMYLSVQDHTLYTFQYIGWHSTHENYMGMLSSNSYTLDNTTTNCTPMYRRVYFGSPLQVAIHPQVTKLAALYIMIHQTQYSGRLFACMLSPWFAKVYIAVHGRLVNLYAQLPLCFVCVFKL